ncbi:LPXTG cell wall anchor domain-containing protein, partial [Enterococcus casseliflavus]
KKVEAKEIGANVQKDGTVTVKGSDGKMKVLPKTGETENIALSIIGSLSTLASGFFLFNRNKKGQA